MYTIWYNIFLEKKKQQHTFTTMLQLSNVFLPKYLIHNVSRADNIPE